MKTTDLKQLKQLYKHFSIIPVKETKAPAIRTWKPYRENKIEFEKLSKYSHFAIICGFDNLEVIDIDNHFGDADDLYQYIIDNIPGEFPEFPIISTKGGGYHIYFKCKEIEGNQKLAQRINDKGRPETLVETRGAGGYVVGPPTEGYDLIAGNIFDVPKISEDQRNVLIEICKSLHEIDPNAKQESKNTNNDSSEKPGDLYNNDAGSIEETIGLLKKAGWKTSDNKHFTRPDKKTGVSATFGKVGLNKFYVFSSNAFPFEPDESYTMFGVRATLLHGGDYSECAKELHQKFNSLDIKLPAKKEKKKEKPAPRKSKDKWKVLMQIIKDWGLKFRFNELTKVLEFSRNDQKFEQLGLLIGDIIREMELNRGVKAISSSKVLEMISNTTICEIYNPIKKFFNMLPEWDGEDHFQKLTKYIELAIDEKPDFFYSMLKKHVIRACKCALYPEYTNRMVLTFYGGQEIGKSMFFRWLVPNEIYNEEPINPADKDSILALSRYLIINLEELDSLNKKDVSKLKAFISRGDVTKRVAYGRHEEKFTRISSFVGNTNKSDILADETNTRWIIVKVKKFNWKAYTKEIDPLQLWSQAIHEMKLGPESGELNIAEKGERELRNNQQFLETTQEREILMKYFDEGEDLMTATDVKILIERKIPNIKINLNQLVRELRRVHGESELDRVGGKVGRYYKLKNSFIPDYADMHGDFKAVQSKDELPF